MADTPDRDEKTEAATPKRREKARDDGDVLQSRDLGSALVVMAGALWLAMAGGWLVAALRTMLADGLSFNRADVTGFDPAAVGFRLLARVAVPVAGLMGLTLLAALAAPALVGSLGFRAGAFGFKGHKLNPLSGLKRMVGLQGLIELGKSVAKVVLLGAIGWWLFRSQQASILDASTRDMGAAIGELGRGFSWAVLVMAAGLVAIAGIDLPMQVVQRNARLRMTKQEVKDENKQSEGSPELKGAIRRRQMQMSRQSARRAVTDATVVLVNPTHFAVALQYRPGTDVAPTVLARGRGATAQVIRELAGELAVPLLSYPQLTRALYYTSRDGQVIREDLYVAVATVLAFVLNLEASLKAGRTPPDVSVPVDARFDEDGRRGA
jgi:flagellar biosynthetic protein FlhB